MSPKIALALRESGQEINVSGGDRRSWAHIKRSSGDTIRGGRARVGCGGRCSYLSALSVGATLAVASGGRNRVLDRSPSH